MFCNKCGKQLASDAAFCSGCGIAVLENKDKIADTSDGVMSAPSHAIPSTSEKSRKMLQIGGIGMDITLMAAAPVVFLGFWICGGSLILLPIILAAMAILLIAASYPKNSPLRYIALAQIAAVFTTLVGMSIVRTGMGNWAVPWLMRGAIESGEGVIAIWFWQLWDRFMWVDGLAIPMLISYFSVPAIIFILALIRFIMIRNERQPRDKRAPKQKPHKPIANTVHNQEPAVPAPVVQDAPSFGFAVLGFFFPVVGLILYLVWFDRLPYRARSAGKGALVGVISSVVLTIIPFVILIILL